MPNAYLVSLPYKNKFLNASDIVFDIEGSYNTSNKINRVGLWYPDFQAFSMYSFKSSLGAWVGINWAVNSGEPTSNAIYINITSTASPFTWTVAGVDKNTGLIINRYTNQPNDNPRQIPYTGKYRKASDIVTEIEGGTGPNTNTKIIKLGLWHRDAQAYSFYRYSSSIGAWVGIDFDIKPGDIINIYPSSSISSFTWTPGLVVTPEP
jgi:hypothetical protein